MGHGILNMSKYGDLQYEIDRPEPSELFLRARNIAGSQIQEQFNRFNTKVINSSNEGFKWIKEVLTYLPLTILLLVLSNNVLSIIPLNCLLINLFLLFKSQLGFLLPLKETTDKTLIVDDN